MSSTPKNTTKEAKDTRIRRRPGVVKPTSAPLGGIRFNKFIYILAAVTGAFAIYYAYRLSEIQRTKANNFKNTMRQAQGSPPLAQPTKLDRRAELQGKIEDLAAMLGLQPVVLASAIAQIVRPDIPEASASSIVEEVSSIEKEEKTTNSVLSAFTEGLTVPVTPQPTAIPKTMQTAASNGGMAATTSNGGMAATILSAVKAAGFDDMGMDAD